MEGNLELAGVHLRDLPDQLFAAGLNDPALPLWADSFETLVGLGELERARVYVRRHEQTARAIGNPRAAAVGARCRGLIAAAEGDFPAAFSALDQALDGLDGLELPLERARMLLCLGVTRRRAHQKRAAREALEQAVATFEEAAAVPWAGKARAELARIAGRRPSSTGLTETEHRVTELAAAGRSNKEIRAPGPVDVFRRQPYVAAWAFAVPRSGRPVAYATASTRAAAQLPCLAEPEISQAVTIGGTPARLISMRCPAPGGVLMLTALTTGCRSALVVMFEDASGIVSAERPDRAAFRELLADIRLQG